MHDDEYTRRVFDELHVDDESERFFDELRERLERGDRRAMRRWRRAAIAFAAAALAASATAGVLAAQPTTTATTIDRTVQCANLSKGGGSPFFDVTSQPGSPPPHADGELPPNLPAGFKPLPAIEVVSGDALTLLTTSFVVSGYQLDRTRCVASHASPPLSPHRLPEAMTLDRQARVVFHVRCIAPRMIVRIQLTTDSAGIPLKAK